MILFGAAVSDREMFDSFALPGIRRVAEPSSRVITRHGCDSIQQPYNEMMDEAAELDALEALVLVHQDLELLDDSLLRRVRPLLAEPDVGVVGLFGARHPPLHRWADVEQLYGRATSPYVDIHHSIGSHEVGVVDGALLVLAPWVVRTIRFSEALAEDFHGYDVDFCLRVRASGGRVICNDIPYMHHMERPWSDSAATARAGWAVARMWDPALRPAEWAPAFPPWLSSSPAPRFDG